MSSFVTITAKQARELAIQSVKDIDEERTKRIAKLAKEGHKIFNPSYFDWSRLMFRTRPITNLGEFVVQITHKVVEKDHRLKWALTYAISDYRTSLLVRMISEKLLETNPDAVINLSLDDYRAII